MSSTLYPNQSASSSSSANVSKPFSIKLAANQILATIVAGALLSSGFIHMLNPYLFLRTIYSYGIVGAIPGQFAAIWLPFLQIALGACMLFRVSMPAVSLLSTGLLSVFVVAQSVAYFGNAAISCGCFGFSTKAIGPESLTIVSSLLLASIFVFWSSVMSETESITRTAGGGQSGLSTPPDGLSMA